MLQPKQGIETTIKPPIPMVSTASMLGPPADCVLESRRRRKKMRYEQQQTWEITPEDQHIALNPRWALEDVFPYRFHGPIFMWVSAVSWPGGVVPRIS
jgi:hypothetical protein